jgi:hypothetical protein
MAMSFKPLRLAPPLCLAPIAGLMLVAGCDTLYPNGSLDPGFGETARYNAALQTIDPDPRVASGASQPGDNGAVGAAAAKRYRTDTVKPVEQVQTSTTVVGSGPN